jgi:hypothetical protein
LQAIALAGLLMGLAGCASTSDPGLSPPAAHHITELAINENPAALVLIIKASPVPAYTATRQTAPTGVLIAFVDCDLQIAPKTYRPPDNAIINWIEVREIVAGTTTAQLFITLKADRPYNLAQDADGIRVIFSKAPAVSRTTKPAVPITTNTAPATSLPKKSAPVRPAAAPVTLTWDPVPDTTAYRVYWSDSPGVVPHSAKKLTVTTNRVEISGLLPGKTYYFVVTSVRGSQESQPSAELSFTVGQ